MEKVAGEKDLASQQHFPQMNSKFSNKSTRCINSLFNATGPQTWPFWYFQNAIFISAILYVKAHNIYYCSLKIFSHFWLVKTTRIIHHNQLLFTKFGKNLRHIESMASKVQPTENYWINDVKMTSKMQPTADHWTVDRENLGTRLCYIWWAENQRAQWQNSFKKKEIIWMNNTAIIEFGFRRIWRILISEGVIHLGLRPLWITPSLICIILHILLSLIQ